MRSLSFGALSLALVLLFLAAISFSATAHAEGARLSLGPVAGATSVQVNSNNGSSITDRYSNNGVGYGVSALVEVPASPVWGIETGAIYLNRKFGIGNSDLQVMRTVPTLLIPVEARYWIGDIVSLAAGGFGAICVGQVTDTIVAGEGSTTINSNQRKDLEGGLTAAVDFNFAIARKTGLFVEGRYNYGLTDSADNGLFKERMRDALMVAGLRMDLTP